jgi:hypothetical protein
MLPNCYRVIFFCLHLRIFASCNEIVGQVGNLRPIVKSAYPGMQTSFGAFSSRPVGCGSAALGPAWSELDFCRFEVSVAWALIPAVFALLRTRSRGTTKRSHTNVNAAHPIARTTAFLQLNPGGTGPGFAVLLDLLEAFLGFPTEVPNPLGRSLG